MADPTNNSPIGIFDSGIGGLTVAKAIHHLLPHESLIYFGDTAHLPYGDKSAKAIRSYALRISNFLLEKGCKAIVIACNTASSVAYNQVRKHTGSQVMVANVIDPMVRYVQDHHATGKIGVIGTKGTIASRVYPRKIRKANPDLEVASAATPLLCPMIEEGFFNNNISRTIIHSYLSRPQLQDINALILGCTHYPLIKNEVGDYYDGQTDVIDSSEVVAQHVRARLQRKQLLSTRTSRPRNRFFVSDYTDAFAESTRLFFSDDVQLKKAAIWD
ncbi:MAG: glutamate racemase [Bacteroidota bacterium]